jgi:predicted metal-dependent hydrolase
MSKLREYWTMIGEKKVPFRVIRTTGRQKTIALQVQPDGHVVVRTPIRTPPARIEDVLQRKAAWISTRRRIAMANTMPTKSTKEFVAGETFFLLGQQRRLEFVSRTGPIEAIISGRSLVMTAPLRRALEKKETRDALRVCFQREAGEVFRLRLQRFLSKFGLSEAPRLVIADQSRRWGSCTGSSALRLNWRLVGAPISLIDYVIVHELCHVRWRDHSVRFWRELRRIMPDYLLREGELARIGPDLVF